MSSILFVENLKINDNPMSTCYVRKCLTIKNDKRFDFYDPNENKNLNLAQYSTVIFGCRAIYLYKLYKGKVRQDILNKNINLCQIKNKYFIIQDMHPKTYRNIDVLCKFINEHNINIIFTFFHNAEAKNIRNKTPNVKHLYLCHHIDTSIFNYLNLKKNYDILLFGSIHPRHYPFRKRLFDLILKNKELFNVCYIPKPDIYDPEICEEGLAKTINMSKICIATKSKYDYLVGKYFEISICKSLIAGDIPTDGKDILKNRIVELNNNMSDDEIINHLKNALDKYDEFEEKINYLHNYINTNYGLNNYVNKLYSLIKN